MPEYFVKGTISVQIMSGRPSQIMITPCVGFLTPFKPHNAIAFPSAKATDPALIIDLAGKQELEYDASKVKDHIHALITIAIQQKPIKIYLSGSTAKDLEVVGFTFPAP